LGHFFNFLNFGTASIQGSALLPCNPSETTLNTPGVVMNLKLFQKYMIPMKTQNVVDSCLVDEIFYKINEIYMHHATFIAFLARAMHDSSTTIGDIINRNVRR